MNSQEERQTHAIPTFDWLDPFQPHRWFRGGWLQTISIKTLRPELDPDSYPGAVAFEVTDDQTPPDTLTGYYLPPESERASSEKPTVVLFHGMGGHACSGYMRSLAEHLLRYDYPVILWNNRGAGGSASSCARLHHPGITRDVDSLLDYLHQQRPSWTRNGLLATAFSLGANLLLRYLGERGDQAGFLAATTISAPLDMRVTSKRLRCGMNKVFDRYLLKRQQQELLRPGAKLTDREREVIRGASSVWELDDQFTAPRFGFDGAEDYYGANSAIDVLDNIRIPTLLVHASDDPVVDEDVFLLRDWCSEGPLFAALTDSGGHSGFLNALGKRWHETATVQFFEDVLSRGAPQPAD